MKQDQPLHFSQRLISQHSGKDGPRRNRHSPGRQRDQGRDAERNRQKHDESQGTEPDPFMPADLEPGCWIPWLFQSPRFASEADLYSGSNGKGERWETERFTVVLAQQVLHISVGRQ